MLRKEVSRCPIGTEAHEWTQWHSNRDPNANPNPNLTITLSLTEKASDCGYVLQGCQSVSNIVRVQSPAPPLSSPPSLLEVGPLNPARGSGGAVSSHSGVWGKAPAANDFAAFSGWRNAAGGVCLFLI